jgi:DNA gyrase subunit A
MAVTDKTGKLVSAKMISEDDRKNSQILLISKEGQTIKMTFK